MDAKITKPAKTTRNIPERHKESSEEDVESPTLNLAGSNKRAMDAKITKPAKATRRIPECHKELSEEDAEPTILDLARSLVAEHNELRNIEIGLRFKQAGMHYEKQYQEIKRNLDEMKLIIRNQELANCLRKRKEEQRLVIERIVIMVLAFLAAIGKLIGLF